VEDDEGHLVGLVTHRDLLRLLERSLNGKLDQPVAVRQIMKTDPATAGPDMPALEAIDIMRRNKIGCLPIVAEGRLVGIVTSYDFLEASASLFQHQLNSNVFKKGAL
jgi:CBS domain-containing protein